MATFGEIMNSGLVYGLCYAVIAVVIVICAVFYIKSKKQAEKYGVTPEQIKEIIKSSMVLTVVPSLSIIIGIFTLSAIVGVPWAQLRLSVIGSLIYELVAAEMATNAMGIADTTVALASPATVFGIVMFIMSISITAGAVTNAIVCKPLTQGLKKMGAASKFTVVRNSCFMIAMFAVMIPIYWSRGIVAILVLITSAVCSELITKIANKFQIGWLHGINLSVCLIIGMFSSVLWTNLFV